VCCVLLAVVGGVALVYGSAGVVHHGQIFYDFSFGHGTTHMRKINRNSTSLQVHACVRLIVTLRLYRYTTSSVCTL